MGLFLVIWLRSGPWYNGSDDGFIVAFFGDVNDFVTVLVFGIGKRKGIGGEKRRNSAVNVDFVDDLVFA